VAEGNRKADVEAKQAALGLNILPLAKVSLDPPRSFSYSPEEEGEMARKPGKYVKDKYGV